MYGVLVLGLAESRTYDGVSNLGGAVVMWALLAVGLTLAIPASIVFLFWRQRKLRQELLRLGEIHSEQNDASHRELLEVKRQLAKLSPVTQSSQEIRTEVPQAVSPAPRPIPEKPAVPISVEMPATVPEKPITPAAFVPKPPIPAPPGAPPAIERKPGLGAKQGPPRFCGWCGTVHAGGVESCPTKVTRPAESPPSKQPVVSDAKIPVNQEQPAVARESQPAAVHAVVPAKPADIPAPVVPPSVPKPLAPHAPSAPQAPPAARVVAPQQFASLRAPAAKPAAGKRMKSVFALEETLGRNWLNKLGITLLVLGIASYGIYELGQLGPLGKVGVSYAVSLALLAGGIFFERRERYRVLGHTLIGGGWALLFFTTYALHHVDAMRVMSSETTDLILMLAVALAMVVHTLRYRSQLVTGLAFLLAYSTVALSHDSVYSLSAGVILAIGLISIVLKMGWFELEVFGILSSYLNHLYWLYRLLGPAGAQGHAFPDYHASTALLLFYWLTFRISYVVRKIRSSSDERMSTTAALLNTLLLLGTMKFQSVQPELAFYALLIIGAIEFGLGQLPITRRRREAFVVLTILGSALMITAVPFRYSGNNVAILWLVGAEALLIAGAIVGEVVFRRLGLLAGLLVGAHLAGIDFQQLMTARQSGEAIVLTAGMMFALCAVVFYANALFVAQGWRLFANWPDAQLISIHSYVGAFAAVSGAWALCSKDWTALTFAGTMVIVAWFGRALNSPPLKTSHLQVQYGVIGCIALYRTAIVNLHTEIPQYTHVQTRLITLPILAAMFYVTAKWAALGDDKNQRTYRDLFAFAGTALVTALIYYEVPEFWQPFAAIAFAVVLFEVAQQIRYFAFVWHAHLLSALALVVAVTTDPSGGRTWHSIPVHAFAALPVVAGAYWIAKRIQIPNAEQRDVGRAAYSWAATGLMAWILFEATLAPWISVSWIVFAIAIAVAMRWIDYKHLAWQANAMAAAAVVRTFTFNETLEQKLWHGFSLRLVTVSIVAAGLYFLSRKASARQHESASAITYLHTLSATALLALLAWYEAPSGWVAALWAIFALVLAMVDRRFKLEDLGWQAHALAALTMLRSVGVNLYVTDTWHGISVRLLSLAIVTVVFYSLSRLVRMPEDWRVREYDPIYSWAASALVSLLMWYELQPVAVAVGWAVFGLVLFEYGLMRNVRQFRVQSYVALTAAFTRIFFANLTAGTPGEFWGPRIYTILPITLILFFVYSQLGTGDKNVQDDSRLRFDMLLAYLGTGTVVALLYFQFANDWLVTAWASVVFVWFAVALWLHRPIFLHQALLLTVAACTRGIMHNLFGASYFTGDSWTGRFFVQGSAIAILFACLPLAFRMRSHTEPQTASRKWLAAILGHPEQFMFFAPIVLLTLMLALKMRAGMVTVSWGLEGVLIVLIALAINERSFRLTGLVLLLLCVGKVLAMDAWGLAPRDRYITFISLGAALLLVSFLYSKYRDTIRQFL